MPTERPAAACAAVTKTYLTRSEEVQALRGVDAEFRAGAVTALVGASGSGKSSLLRLLAGLDVPTEGKVALKGLSLGSLPGKGCAVSAGRWWATSSSGRPTTSSPT